MSCKVFAEVDFTDASQGVIFAAGSRFGGDSLFIKDGTLTYAYNFRPGTRRVMLGAAPTASR